MYIGSESFWKICKT